MICCFSELAGAVTIAQRGKRAQPGPHSNVSILGIEPGSLRASVEARLLTHCPILIPQCSTSPLSVHASQQNRK